MLGWSFIAFVVFPFPVYRVVVAYATDSPYRLMVGYLLFILKCFVCFPDDNLQSDFSGLSIYVADLGMHFLMLE